MGGSRFSNCSMMEAIALCERVAGKKMNAVYHDENRIGDHIWYISDVAKFEKHYPQWKLTWNLERIAVDIFEQTVRKGAV